MNSWKIACVQIDCQLGKPAENLAVIRTKLAEAVENNARLIIFPECALTGYGYASKAEAWPFAEPVPGPMVETLQEDCRKYQVYVVVGSLEKVEATGDLFNVAVLIGPDGLIGSYRKLHLPYLGVDRFVTPGDREMQVHDLGGLRLGMSICYDAGFPETARAYMLLGADLVILPTNWPEGARNSVKYLVQARAVENQIYYACCNRVGTESGFRFIGNSRIIHVSGDLLASAGESEEIIYGDVRPQVARNKHIVHKAGEYELHRVAHRRPEMYGVLTAPLPAPFVPSKNAESS